MYNRCDKSELLELDEITTPTRRDAEMQTVSESSTDKLTLIEKATLRDMNMQLANTRVS